MLDKRTGRKATKEREAQREKQRQIREYSRANSALVRRAVLRLLRCASSARACILQLLLCAWIVCLGASANGPARGHAMLVRAEAAGCRNPVPGCLSEAPPCIPPALPHRPCVSLPLSSPAPPQQQCRLCFASSHRPRQLTLAIGQSTYLALPARGRLVPGHCVIVPAEHVPSARQLDEQARAAGRGVVTGALAFVCRAEAGLGAGLASRCLRRGADNGVPVLPDLPQPPAARPSPPRPRHGTRCATSRSA